MALHSDESRCRPLGNTFLPLGDFSSEKADKHRRHSRAHSYSGYVPYRLGYQDEISSCYGELTLADVYEQLTMQRHVEDFFQHTAPTKVPINEDSVNKKPLCNGHIQASETVSTASKLSTDWFEPDEFEEFGVQKGGQTIFQCNDHNDGAVQNFKQKASTVPEEVCQPRCSMSADLLRSRFVTTIHQNCNQFVNQVQSSSPLGKRMVCLAEFLDSGDDHNVKSKRHATKECAHQKLDHLSCLQDECSGTPPSSSECG